MQEAYKKVKKPQAGDTLAERPKFDNNMNTVVNDPKKMGVSR